VGLPGSYSNYWGPSVEELARMRRGVLLDAVVSGEDDEDEFEGAFVEEVDVGLTEQLDSCEIVDQYRNDED
jgi:hypothetical protein